MQTILFYEDVDPSKVIVVAFDVGALAWRETILKQSLEVWLKETIRGSRITKEDGLFVVLPETVVARCMLQVPPQCRTHERRAMAENTLMIAFNERAALLRMAPCEPSADGQVQWAVSGVKQSVYETWQSLFGSFAVRVKWLSAVECALAFETLSIKDGLYILEAPLWTGIFAVKNGVVLQSAAAEGRDYTTLQMTVFEATKAFGLAPSCTTLFFSGSVTLHEDLLPEVDLKKTRHAHRGLRTTHRTFWALILGCVVVPCMLWLGAQMRPTTAAQTIEQEALVNTGVQKSHYSRLIEGAYQAKSERITILSQEASEDALAIHGRCREALDLADYMKSLNNKATSLHPLLLDLAKKTDKENVYYEFVVEVSLEGREKP